MGVPICKKCFDKSTDEQKIDVDVNYYYPLGTSCSICEFSEASGQICIPISGSIDGEHPLDTFQRINKEKVGGE